MNSRFALPFLTLPEETVKFDGWRIGDPGEPLLAAQDVLENWDYARDLEIACTIAFDWLRASNALQLPTDKLQLKVALVIGTGVGNLPRRQLRLQEFVLGASSGPTRLAGISRGHNLSGRIRLMLQVTLEAPLAQGTLLSPKARGSRLWQSSQDILIEDGGDSRFPVETASFSEIFAGKAHESSPWCLFWRPNALQTDFSAGVRLYINSDIPELHSRFVAGDASTLQAIMADVISQMIEPILAQDDCADMLAEFEEGSVGAQIRKWLEIGFPGQDVAKIRALKNLYPGMFRAAVLASSSMEAVE